MDELFTQIKKGLDNNLYYLALFVSLTVPDMCAALESDDGKTNRSKYKAWVNEYLVKARPDKYGEQLSSDHIYQFRCALLHQGSTKHDSSEYQRILFFEPGAQTAIVGPHCCIVGSKTRDASLMIDIQQFCADIIKGAQVWHQKNRTTRNYRMNYERFIKRYPDGISPVFGAPVIG